MSNYFTSICLLTHLGVNNIWATGVLNKNRLHKCTIVGKKQPQKKGMWSLWTAHIKQKKQCNFDRSLFKLLKESMKESIFQNNHQINSTVTTRTWVLFDRMDVSKYKIVIRMKKWSWFPFAYIVDVFLQNALVLYHINKDEGDESLPLLAWNFS